MLNVYFKKRTHPTLQTCLIPRPLSYATPKSILLDVQQSPWLYPWEVKILAVTNYWRF